jgi:hypothetical protein
MITQIYRGRNDKLPSKHQKDIPVSETFTGKISKYDDWLFLNTFSGIVSLKNPGNTWMYSPDTLVQDYCPVDLEIEVVEKKEN